SVIVIINKTHTPSGVGHGYTADSGWVTIVSKCSVAIVAVERVHLAGEVSHHDIGETLIVVICEIPPHAWIGVPLAIHGDSRTQPNFLECAIAFVVEKKFGHGVVGDKDVQMAVSIVIRKSDTQTLAWNREARLV